MVLLRARPPGAAALTPWRPPMQTIRPTWRAMRALTAADAGATMVEYALMLALIAIVALGAVATLGAATSSSFAEVTACTQGNGQGNQGNGQGNCGGNGSNGNGS